ncbi:MAG: glucosaminidase domain-containing protein [Saprospiraceae bacterium]
MQTQILTILLCLPFLALGQMEVQMSYIDNYKEIAIQEMDRAGVPASIKLAQALLESNAGQSELAQRANNHFGIKCGSDWQGKTYHKEDDDYDEQGKLVKSCFRSYRRPEESFVAHSEFLRDPKKEWRYGFLFRLDPLDYKSWATGLKKAGYATSATYDQKLISIIERYQLFQYDRLPMTDPMVNVEEETYEDMLIGVFQVNDVDVVIAKEGETPQDIAGRTGRDINKIMQYNELLAKPSAPLEKGERVYLELKRNYYRGDRKFHYVKEGETMYDIAQLYGVKLEKLYMRNRMPANSQPAANERVRLRGKTRKDEDRPKLTSEVMNKPSPIVNIDDFAWPPEEDPFGGTKEEPPVIIETPPPSPVLPPEPPAPVEPKPVDDKVLPPPVVISVPPSTPPADPAPPAAPVYHTVVKGDTLYNLSKRYNTTVDAIRSLNGLTDNTIKIGQSLRVQ